MSYQHILFELKDGIARLTLNRIDKLNSFITSMHLEVREALQQVRSSADTRVLVLTGAGRGFCTGQDLGDRAVASAWPCWAKSCRRRRRPNGASSGSASPTTRVTEVDALARHFAAAPTKELARTKQALYSSASNTLEQNFSWSATYARPWLQHRLPRGGSVFVEKRGLQFKGE